MRTITLAHSAERRHPHEGYIPAAHVGTLLQETRLRLGQDLRIVADDLRIRYHHLLAIEDGRFDDLPGATYVTGFIRAYAEYLGLDAEEIIRRYKNEPQGTKPADHLDFPAPANSGRLPAGALLLVLLALASLAYGGWYWMSTNNTSVAELIPAIPERLASLMDGGDEATDPATPAPAETTEPTDTTEAPADTQTTTETASGTANMVDGGVPAGDGLAALSPTSPAPSPDTAPSPSPDTTPTQDLAVTAAEEAAPADDNAPAPDAANTPAEPAASVVAASDVTAAEETEETAPAVDASEDPIPPEAPDEIGPTTVAPDDSAANPVAAPAEPVTDDAEDGDAAETAEAPETPEAAAPAIPETETTEPSEVPEPPAEPETEEPVEPEEEPTPAYVGRAAPSEVQSVANGSRIVLRASRDSWIQVRKGGDLVVRRLLRRGDTYAVPTDGGYTLNTSNAGGLEVYVDGQRVRNLGPVGVPRNGVRLSPGSLN